MQLLAAVVLGMYLLMATMLVPTHVSTALEHARTSLAAAAFRACVHCASLALRQTTSSALSSTVQPVRGMAVVLISPDKVSLLADTPFRCRSCIPAIRYIAHQGIVAKVLHAAYRRPTADKWIACAAAAKAASGYIQLASSTHFAP